MSLEIVTTNGLNVKKAMENAFISSIRWKSVVKKEREFKFGKWMVGSKLGRIFIVGKLK